MQMKKKIISIIFYFKISSNLIKRHAAFVGDKHELMKGIRKNPYVFYDKMT